MKGAAAIVRVALSAEQLSGLDSWIASQPEPKLSRPEAMRQLMVCAMIDHPGQ